MESVLNKENIRRLVDTFYPKILKDEIVSPFFIEKIGDDIKSQKWQEHLELIANFWASMAGLEESYFGNPLFPHLNMQGISREAFQRWILLFHQTLDEIYTDETGRFFKERSMTIANNFMRKIGI